MKFDLPSELFDSFERLRLKKNSAWGSRVANQNNDLVPYKVDGEIVIAPLRFIAHVNKTGKHSAKSSETGDELTALQTILKKSGWRRISTNELDKKLFGKIYANYFYTLSAEDRTTLAKREEYFRRGKMTWWLKEPKYAEVLSLLAIPPNELDPNLGTEGRPRQITTNVYERDENARRQCFEHYITNGRIVCQACKIDFIEKYGELGAGFMHIHHLIPLSEIGESYQVDPINDLIPLCPNCHAMIHKLPKDARSLDDLRKRISS